MEQVIQTIKEALAEVLQVSIKNIKDETDIYLEFGMDSLSAVKTLALLDERLNIEVPDENLHNIRTPKDLANLVMTCLEERRSA